MTITTPVAHRVSFQKVRHRIHLDPCLGDGYRLVGVDTKKVDKLLSQDEFFYVGKNGDGGVKHKYERTRNLINGNGPIYAPVLAAYENSNKEIEVGIVDGRHRFANFRDIGFDEVLVATNEKMVHLFKALDVLK